jgi:UDP-glucose-4-epimerase GalE
MSGQILVVGGAGYVGSHCARRLLEAGFDVVTYDNLSTGHQQAVQGELVVGDIRDGEHLGRVLARGFDAVLHFAALLNVGDSVRDPLSFFDVNVRGTVTLLRAMREAHVRSLVFSSTCAVYGVPGSTAITEDTPMAPINPYGQSKKMVEEILAESRRVGEIRAISLRYFNAAGCSLDGVLGEAHVPETHLIPLALRAHQTQRPLQVFGTAHPTPDGTCIRDYVHVEDLAEAHFEALLRVMGGSAGRSYNLGTGTGASVREVLTAVAACVGQAVPSADAPARAGDPPRLVADPSLAAQDLGWQAKHDLAACVRTAWSWACAPRYGA